MINLESVGTGLSGRTGMTYPMLEKGSYDYDNGIQLDDILLDGDWILALSHKDKCKINNYFDCQDNHWHGYGRPCVCSEDGQVVRPYSPPFDYEPDNQAKEKIDIELKKRLDLIKGE